MSRHQSDIMYPVSTRLLFNGLSARVPIKTCRFNTTDHSIPDESVLPLANKNSPLVVDVVDYFNRCLYQRSQLHISALHPTERTGGRTDMSTDEIIDIRTQLPPCSRTGTCR